MPLDKFSSKTIRMRNNFRKNLGALFFSLKKEKDILKVSNQKFLMCFRKSQSHNMDMEKSIFYAKVFKALSDSKRLLILEELKREEKCACDLQQMMNLTQSGLSYHMKVLSEANLVISRQEGKWTYYRTNPTGVNDTIEFLKFISVS